MKKTLRDHQHIFKATGFYASQLLFKKKWMKKYLKTQVENFWLIVTWLIHQKCVPRCVFIVQKWTWVQGTLSL